MWIWTSRPGFEADLIEELTRVKKGSLSPRAAGPSLVSTEARPAVWPTFARAGFQVDAEAGVDTSEVARAVATSLERAFAGKPKAWVMSTWVPDADATNPLAQQATVLEEKVLAELEKTRGDLALRRVEAGGDAVRYGGYLAQVCLKAPDRVLVGALPAGDAPTLAPGGRARSRAPKDAPSRAARKLVEALEWFGRAPEAGDICVDLGAAPGGWTAVLLERRAKVIAVDPANMAPHLRKHRNLAHVKESAFDFTPTEPVDWLFCDMAWRPLEVAALLAKWGRRKLANALVANVKLPMKQRVEFVERVLKIVNEGGWRDVKARQLYHDREEITLAAWRV